MTCYCNKARKTGQLSLTKSGGAGIRDDDSVFVAECG